MQTQWSWPIGLIAVMVLIGCTLGACLTGAVVGGLVGHAIGYSAAEKEMAVIQTLPPETPTAPEYPWPERLPSIREGRPAALVMTVNPDSPAEEAGIRPGDLILAVDDQEISPDRELAAIIRDYQPGDRVRLTFWRNGREGNTRVRLGRRRTEDGEVVASLGLTYQHLPMVPLPSP